jgi:hypothetical protein
MFFDRLPNYNPDRLAIRAATCGVGDSRLLEPRALRRPKRRRAIYDRLRRIRLRHR